MHEDKSPLKMQTFFFILIDGNVRVVSKICKRADAENPQDVGVESAGNTGTLTDSQSAAWG